jgi:hypothetical protein
MANGSSSTADPRLCDDDREAVNFAGSAATASARGMFAPRLGIPQRVGGAVDRTPVDSAASRHGCDRIH